MQMPSTDERPPRFYHLLLQEDLLEGWTLVSESGRQGAPGKVKRMHFLVHDEALASLVRERDRQLLRGYRVVYAEGSSASS